MNKTGINSDNISGNDRFRIKDVSSLSIANYGDTDMDVTINDVTETIPAYNAVKKFARSFVISGDGTFTDIDLTVAFPNGSGKAVLRYRTYITDKC